jgi:hypothetical protein
MIGTWRQRQAQEIMLDELVDMEGNTPQAVVIGNAARSAVAVATTVKITQDAIDAYLHSNGGEEPDVLTGLTAAFKALGFEVVA